MKVYAVFPLGLLATSYSLGFWSTALKLGCVAVTDRNCDKVSPPPLVQFGCKTI